DAQETPLLRPAGPAGARAARGRMDGHQQPAGAWHVGDHDRAANIARRQSRRCAVIQVVLCDDHAVLRRGIRDTLTESPDICVTGEAGSYPELREVLRTAACDVLLLDLNLPGRSGLEVLASLKESHPAIKVLIVSMYPEAPSASRCLTAGAQGYATTAGDQVQLTAAVHTVMQGRKYRTPEAAQLLADSLAQPTPELPHESLSEREL